MSETELAAFLQRMTHQISRLTEISEAQGARQQGVVAEIKHLRVQAAGLAQQVRYLRAMYHVDASPAETHWGQRDAGADGDPSSLRDAVRKRGSDADSDRA